MKNVHKTLPSYTLNDVKIMAKTIYGEARGEITRNMQYLSSIKETEKLFPYIKGLIAVGHVIYNRFKQQTWYGKTISDVCLRPYQFSCWNLKDPNRKTLDKLNESSDLFQLCLYVAQGVMNQKWDDFTQGSDHYHAVWLTPHPSWADPECITTVIGHHVFYNTTFKRN